ncbi:MAG TPA: acetyl-CoA hydrolase/transferase C-terminal domain-containing protein, partial [Syntrophales bacterium]
KKRDLGVHTEMLVDSMKHLYEIGVITNKKKALHKDKFVCAFMFGSQELYDWTDNNVAVSVLRARYVNAPAVIRQNSKMTSINTCFMVDLTGQVFSESIGTHQYSGTGGQFDTAVGAREGLDGLGKSIIACRSTAKSGKISRIVSVAPQGTPVTLQRGVSDYIVTEHGVAWLRGKTVRERTESLISIAHPDFREQLKEEAQRMGYMEMPAQGPSYQPLSVVRASK